MTTPRPPFALTDRAGETRRFPTARPSLIAFIKEDCHTCNLAAPLLEAFHLAWGEAADVLVLGQSTEGNDILQDRHGFTLPFLDDSACKTSFAWDFEIVPAVYWIGADGVVKTKLEGFVREEWQALDRQIAADLDAAPAAIAWADLPDWRPGCGSKHLDPEIHDKLQAEADDSPIRARRIEIASADDIAEFMFDQGFSDGLPLIPPTAERVIRMLAGTPRAPQDIVAIVPPNMAPVTVEKIAINAVMAGCKPEYLPVVIAAVEAVCTDEFNMHGVTATTMGASPVLVVNGPIRERIGMNMRLGALGPGSRANATIGRALRLVVRNVGGAQPGGVDRSTLSNPMKFTMCFPEWEEGSPWDPLHVERGFKAEQSTVTVVAVEGTLNMNTHSKEPNELLRVFAECMVHPASNEYCHGGEPWLVLAPEHAEILKAGGLSKRDIKEHLWQLTRMPARHLSAKELLRAQASRADEYGDIAPHTLLSLSRTPDDIWFIVAGGPGTHSVYVPCFGNSRAVTRVVEGF